MYLLRNIGSVNTTIIHECIHWDKHRKAFVLERLYNEAASCISCEVVGGAASEISKKSTEFMEKQANQLAPRIQMPQTPFRAKANEYIATFLRESDAQYEMDVMEMVIDQLAVDFGVSRQAAKIRLVELGFDGAIGTFNYVDGQYVRPHGFRKDSIEAYQTFTISAQDAAIQRFSNPELREKTANGDYLFIENHCSYPGCPNLTDGRFCEEHKREENKHYEKYDRDPAVRCRYGRVWKRVRDAYIKEHPFCEECFKKGIIVPVEEVHHIKPLSEGGTHARENLVSLCKSCHARIHAERGDRWHNKNDHLK